MKVWHSQQRWNMDKNKRKRKDRRSLIKQGQDAYNAMHRFGHKKHLDPPDIQRRSIYSYKTAKCYAEHGLGALGEIRAEFGVRTLEEAKEHVAWYLKKEIDRGLSPYTVNLKASALSKLYGVSNADWGVDLPQRSRAGIKRSRGPAVRDANFSQERNKELIQFCRATGLRRSELENLKGTDLNYHRGHYYLSITGKGGRHRYSRIVGTDEAVANVVRRCKESGKGLVWLHVHNAADIHAYRADYANLVYRQCARPIDQIPRSERYDCRGDKAGISYDKKALAIASKALGHNRLDVVVNNYLR